MNKDDIVSVVADNTGLSKKDVSQVLSAIVAAIIDAVKSGERVSIPGFGSFKRSLFKARKGRNPRTGEEIDIKAKQVPKFSAAANFKDEVA